MSSRRSLWDVCHFKKSAEFTIMRFGRAITLARESRDGQDSCARSECAP